MAMTNLIFSKDRPLQLDGVLRSLQLHCSDCAKFPVTVLWTGSNESMVSLYAALQKEYASSGNIRFVKESEFKQDVLSAMLMKEYVLFWVDDNIVVQDFSMRELIDALQNNDDAIGCSLRLGKNTTYCYPMNAGQRLPAFEQIPNSSLLKFRWPGADYDFGYSLEVSSSIYRTKDILPLLLTLTFHNPNSLEAGIAASTARFREKLPALICAPSSLTFCNPINMVQKEIPNNRFGGKQKYNAGDLARLFQDGKRIDVARYAGFVPNACHQEVDLFLRDSRPIESKADRDEIKQEKVPSALTQVATYDEPKPFSPLKEIATRFDTDKAQSYLEQYEKFFGHLVGENVKLLELGVFRGGSLLMWQDYFKNGLIAGVDMNPVSFPEGSDRIRFYQGYQQDGQLLERIARECAPQGFDIIIDDASHMGKLTRETFNHLFDRHLKPGGLYVIEDWGTGYWDSWPDGKRVSEGVAHNEGMVGFVKELIDEAGMEDVTRVGRGGLSPERTSKFDGVFVTCGQVFITKKGGVQKRVVVPQKVNTAIQKSTIDEPMVSVVIPCYNQAKYLPEAVVSVVAQRYTRWECIIVNDGSTDNTSAVAKRLILEHPDKRIVLLEKANGGLADARNHGIESARGKYILPLDADDAIDPLMIESTVRELERVNCDVVYTDQRYFGVENRPVCTLEFDRKTIYAQNYFGYCSLYKKSMWTAVGGYKPAMKWGYEDWEFWISCAEAGYTFRRLPQPLFRYRVKSDSMLTNARKHDHELKALIVVHHPSLYPQEAVQAARIFLAEKMPKPHRADSRRAHVPAVSNDPFKVIAIVSAFNEGDVIYHVIGDLIANGVNVYLIDNSSTDDTVEQASQWLGKGLLHIERFPDDCGYPQRNKNEYVWRDILRRKEELAAELQADWFIHADADEFRESPFPHTSLREGFKIVDAYGFNAVNFELLNFRPIDNSFVAGEDVRDYLRRYEPGAWFDSNQIKAWKKTAERVDLVSNAGHNVQFRNRKLFPVNFLLRHYPIRSEQHGRKKVYHERITRFAKEERATGWHVQYDDVVKNAKSFLHQASSVIEYDAAEVKLSLFAKASRSMMLAQSDVAQAVSRYEDILRHKPDDVNALKGLAEISLRFVDREALRAYVGRLDSIVPADAKVLEWKALLTSTENVPPASDEAIEEGDNSRTQTTEVDAAPEAMSLNLSGVKAFQQGQITIARELFEDAIAADGNYIDARKNLAEVFLHEGDGAAAVSQYKAILEISPNDVDALSGLGSISTQLKRYDDAKFFFGRVLDIQPDNSDATNILDLLENAERQTEGSTDDVNAPLLASIIIPVFNQVQFTRQCVEAIYRTAPVKQGVEVIVVDNASTDGTREFLEQARLSYPGLSFVRNDVNAGFAKACNRGAAVARGEFLVFLNNDTVPQPGWFEAAISRLQTDNEIGIVGSKLLYPDRTIQHCGIEFIHLDERPYPLWPEHRLRSANENDPRANTVQEIPAVTGACLFISKQLFENVGGLSEAFGMYFEDVDLCVKARKAGKKVVYEPKSVVIHYESKSTVNRIAAGKLVDRAAEIFFQRWTTSDLTLDRAAVQRRPQTGPITVGVDARTFFYSDSITRGIGHYSLYHLSHVIRQRPQWNFVLFGESSSVPPSLKDLLELPNVRLASIEAYNTESLDLMHICDPMNIANGFDSPFRLFNMEKTTVTFYDLIPKKVYMNAWPESMRQGYMQRLEKLKNSNAIALSISEYTKRDLVSETGIPVERVEVIMAGLNASEQRKPAGAARAREVKKRFGINKPFFLHVGALDPHKSFDTVLKAFVECSAQKKCQLVVVGQMQNFVKAYADYVQRNRIKNIVFTGFISREDLEVLYGEARALLFMSMYEGFGFPVLEAMAKGCPVITSNATSIPEVAGDAALMFKFDDVHSVANAISGLVDNEKLRNELRAKGLQRSTMFTWDECARKTLAVWDRMLDVKTESKTDATEISVTAASTRKSEVQPAHKRKQVLYHSALYDPSGYADEGRNFVSGLDRLGFDVVAREIGRHSDQFKNQLNLNERRSIDKHLAKRSHAGCISVIHFPGYAFQRVTGAAYNIGRTMFETDGLPADWVSRCNMMDEVWVPSDFNMATFKAAGVRTKLVKIPGGINIEQFKPGIAPLAIDGVRGKVFLSVFEWSYRKGWDVLLDGWVKAFTPEDDVCLVLRTYPVNAMDGQHSKAEIESRIDAYLKSRHGVARQKVAPIIVLGEQISESEMPSLFAAADVYVAPSRGEGWGRPQMAAMAMGMPVIATRWSGNLEFMNDSNSYLIDVEKLSVIDDRAENPVYRGQKWAEPSVEHLASLMQRVEKNSDEVRAIRSRARADMETQWSWSIIAQQIASRLDAISLGIQEKTTSSQTSLPSVVWEGPQFANSSLALVNRELCKGLVENDYNFSIKHFGPKEFVPQLNSNLSKIQSAEQCTISNPDMHVRHHWPPNLTAPEKGHWIVIQPWEFGSLPKSWVEVFATQVDELWVPSRYVKQVYVASGVPASKVVVVPNGIDPQTFHPQVKPFALKTKMKFRFLFVGGTIFRKGIDLLLDAYTKSFTKSDDVCLVIKDFGGETFYKGQTIKSKISEIQSKRNAPEIEYIDRVLSDEQIAGLYKACNVLVHPYRGEGFGLPILESMACGTPAIVTDGGAALDFCNASNSILVKAEPKRIGEKKIGDLETVDFPWLYEVDSNALSESMRFAFSDRNALAALGKKASVDAQENWTWAKAFDTVSQRMSVLRSRPIFRFSTALALQQISEMLESAARFYHEKKFETVLHLIHLVEMTIEGQVPVEERKNMIANLESLRGDCYVHQQMLDAAQEAYERALHANPNSSTACAGIGHVLYLKGFEEHAKTMFEWAVKYDPSNAGAVVGLAVVNEALGLSANESSLDHAKAIEPQEVDTLFEDATRFYQQRDFDSALESAKRISEMLDGSDERAELNAAALNLQGICNFALGNLDSARAAFESALRLNPESSQACAGLAEVLVQSGQLAHAKTMYEWAVKNNSENGVAAAGLAKVNKKLGLAEDDNSLEPVALAKAEA